MYVPKLSFKKLVSSHIFYNVQHIIMLNYLHNLQLTNFSTFQHNFRVLFY